MYIVCAPDSFKGSLTGPEAARAMTDGVRQVIPDAEIVELPIADGGEGFTETVAAASGLQLFRQQVRDQRGRRHPAPLAIGPGTDGRLTAILDVAATSGLELAPEAERDVMSFHTAGLGELITAALTAGAARLVIGIGGSSTNEAGAGMLHALGVRFRAADGDEVEPNPAGLARVASVDTTGLDQRLAGVDIEVACDVTNPLLGPSGASAVYGPQKGASEAQVAELDTILGGLVTVCGSQAARVAELPGSGAAGGLGWALQHFLGASLRPGLELVAELVDLDAHLARADLILTGEGSVDRQTPHGKAVARVCEHAAAVPVPVLVFGGRVDLTPDRLPGEVIDVVAITPPGQPLAEALRAGGENLKQAVQEHVGHWARR